MYYVKINNGICPTWSVSSLTPFSYIKYLLVFFWILFLGKIFVAEVYDYSVVVYSL